GCRRSAGVRLCRAVRRLGAGLVPSVGMGRRSVGLPPLSHLVLGAPSLLAPGVARASGALAPPLVTAPANHTSKPPPGRLLCFSSFLLCPLIFGRVYRCLFGFVSSPFLLLLF